MPKTKYGRETCATCHDEVKDGDEHVPRTPGLTFCCGECKRDYERSYDDYVTRTPEE